MLIMGHLFKKVNLFYVVYEPKLISGLLIWIYKQTTKAGEKNDE
jgi:hypothetical protein